MSDALFQISLGILLGHASIQKNSSSRQEKWGLKILQGVKHRAYVEHLHEKFADYVRAAPALHRERVCLSFSTLFHTDFNPLAPIFVHPQGKNHVGVHFSENSISPVTLAYWFMDDGGALSYNKEHPPRGLVLNTHFFPRDECEILLVNLNSTYNFGCWCKKNKGRHIVAFPGKSWNDIWQVISPHVLESMRYKFPRLGGSAIRGGALES